MSSSVELQLNQDDYIPKIKTKTFSENETELTLIQNTQTKITKTNENELNIETIEFKDTIVKSYLQTKNWRKNQKWYVNGKSNECEIFQIGILERIMGTKLKKTNERINIELNEIINIRTPYVFKNGFEFTENFDGKINLGKCTFYFNLKFICENGGAQIRSIKEVYFFIKAQLKYLQENSNVDIKFINLLDGQFCFNNISKFEHLQSQFNIDKKKIFIGDIHQFINKYFVIE